MPIHNQTNQPALVCNMTVFSPTEREQHLATIRQLLTVVEGTEELRHGYALRFASGSEHLSLLAEFIAGERRCCPFLSFAVEVEAGGGPTWLRLTGPEGIKEFLREELGTLAGGQPTWATEPSGQA